MKELLQNLKQKLEQRLPSFQYSMWLHDMEYISYDNQILSLSTSSNFKKEWIDQHYKKLMEHTLTELSNKNIRIEILAGLEKNKKNSEIKKNEHKSNSIIKAKPSISTNKTSISQNTTTCSLNKKYTFPNYIVGPNNKIPYETARKVASNPGKRNPLFIYGKVGVGKTHLMQSIGNYIQENSSLLKVFYETSQTFVQDFVSSLRNKTDYRFRLKYKSLDIFLLDDVQFFMKKDQSEKELFNIFNELYLANKQMVFCSDRTPAELENIDDRLKSRLSSSIIVEIEPPSYETKLAIIQFYLKKDNFDLSQEIIEYLAEKLPDDIRIIEGALEKLQITKEITEIDIDKNFCIKFLKEHIFSIEKKHYSPEKIIWSVANYSNISISDLRSAKRNKNFAYYRQLSMYLLKKYTNLSYNDIGNHLGGKQHSTIIHGIKNIEKEIEKNPNLSKTITSVLTSVE